MLRKSFFTLPAESFTKNTEVKLYLVMQHVTMVMSTSKLLS